MEAQICENHVKNLAYMQLVFQSHTQTQSHSHIQLLNISAMSVQGAICLHAPLEAV